MALSVAVVTSTIGRPTLRQTVESVKAQTRQCEHYVFIHGQQYAPQAWSNLPRYNHTKVVQLPHNGNRPNSEGMGYGMAPVYAMAGFVVAEDVVMYLDDDNWYEPDHVESLVSMIEEKHLDFAYSLRNICADDGSFICRDDCESLGYFPNAMTHHFCDNSVMAVRTKWAKRCGHAWYRRTVSDRSFFRALTDLDLRIGCSGLYTCNYRISKDSINAYSAENFKTNNAAMQSRFPQGFPWRQRTYLKLED
jgi:glycosyltransferase involved in cell wall biosynthesis